MIDYYQGPGRNIKFCSITTGINIDPNKGYWAKEVYNWIKSMIQERSEIHIEHRTIREIQDINASTFLPAYSATPRSVFQFLFGLVEHNNVWTEQSLQEFLDERTQSIFIKAPQDGEFSIDFDNSRDSGFKLFENQNISMVDVWVEKMEFYYSNKTPIHLDGNDKDVWFVCTDGSAELLIKNAYTWYPLQTYANAQSPSGLLYQTITDPGNSTNSWWLDTTGVTFRKFNASINTWEPASNVVFTNGPVPISPVLGDLWVKITGGKWQLFEYTVAGFMKRKISPIPVQDRTANSLFVGTPGLENFVIVCGEDALTGAPIPCGGTTLEIRKDSVVISTAVECINFIGPDLSVFNSPGCVNVEHLPYTTLPELVSSPTNIPDSGRLFTQDVGGQTELFYIDDAGNITQITPNVGINLQSIHFTAMAGQTNFGLPGVTTSVLTMKINGVDTTYWTYSSPTATFNPVAANYAIQAGDIVTFFYFTP